MFRVAAAIGLVFIAAACGGTQAARDGSPAPTSSAPPSASPSPVQSPSPARQPLLVFVKAGTVALVRSDGSLVKSVDTTMDSGEIAQRQFAFSDGALIGRYWGADGNPTSPLALGVLGRDGIITPLAPQAAKVLTHWGAWWSPIVLGGELLQVQATFEKADYVRLDLATGDQNVLISATPLPPTGYNDGPPPLVEMTAMGTSPDGSVARVAVTHVKVAGQSIDGSAYFEIDLRSNHVTGPRPLPNVGRLAMSGDGRFIGWWEWAPIGGSAQRDLHVRDLSSGAEWTVPDVPYMSEAENMGIRFSPDDGYVALEGLGKSGSAGFAVYNMATHRMVGAVPATEPDEPFAEVPLWWTDSHTVVYETNQPPPGLRMGHRFDATTGAVTDYPAELGAPVLLLASG